MRTAYSGWLFRLSMGVSLLWLGSTMCLGQNSKSIPERQPSLAAVSCKALKGLEIPASALSLPTTVRTFGTPGQSAVDKFHTAGTRWYKPG